MLNEVKSASGGDEQNQSNSSQHARTIIKKPIINPTSSKLRWTRRWWFWRIIFLIVIGAFGVFVYSANRNDEQLIEQQQAKQTGTDKADDKYVDQSNKFQWPSKTAKYITALPVDLTQIQSISKFRSCAGHDRDGYNFDQVLETARSMKHYFYPIPEFQGTMDHVRVYSPVDGEITSIDYEQDKVGGRPHNGGGLHISPTIDKNASIVLGHIYTVKDYKIGDKVTAGELVGYASLGDAGNDFDVDLSTPRGTSAYNEREVLDSIFDHMIPEVLAAFANYGITPENTKFTKEYRDAHLCDFNSDDRAGDNWIRLIQ